MGCGSSNQRHSRQRYTPRLSPEERHALQHRVPLCQSALRKLIETIHPELGATLKRLVDASPSSFSAGHEDGDNDSNGDNAALWCPHVGVLYSGGGWRAMTAGAAATDALSQTGILDGVETVAGLSGGSWFVTQWALGGKECNVFHDTEKAEHHPWAYGNVFNPAVHHYDGLKRILSEKVVRRAAKLDRSKITQDLGRFADSLTNTDATFFSLLFLSPGGNSMVTRYASFLEDQLFVWAGGSGTDEKARLTIENESIKNAISQGTFPTLLCAAIDTVENDAEVAEAQKGKSKNIWCEFSPFGARHCLCQEGKAFPMTQLTASLDDASEPITAGRMAAICGSAFAVDNATLLKSVPEALGKVMNFFGVKDDPGKIVLPKVLTEVHMQPAQPSKSNVAATTTKTKEAVDPDNLGPSTKNHFFGALRDAGLDFNVPFPLLLEPSSGRNLDIIIALDAGKGADGAGELSQAVRCGYIEIDGETAESLASPFPSGTRVRVFKPPSPSQQQQQQQNNANKGPPRYPIIVYVLLLNRTESYQLSYSKTEVDSLTAFASDIVKNQLMTVFSHVLCNWVIDKIEKESAKHLGHQQQLQQQQQSQQQFDHQESASIGDAKNKDEENTQVVASPTSDVNTNDLTTTTTASSSLAATATAVPSHVLLQSLPFPTADELKSLREHASELTISASLSNGFSPTESKVLTEHFDESRLKAVAREMLSTSALQSKKKMMKTSPPNDLHEGNEDLSSSAAVLLQHAQTPLDFAQAMELYLMSLIPADTRLAAYLRLSQLASAADEEEVSWFHLSDPVDDVDRALLTAGWVREVHHAATITTTTTINTDHHGSGANFSSSKSKFVFLDDLLWDYLLCVNATASAMLLLANDNRGASSIETSHHSSNVNSIAATKQYLSKLLRRPIGFFDSWPLPSTMMSSNTGNTTWSRISLKPEWKFVCTFLAMLTTTATSVSAGGDDDAEFQQRLKSTIVNRMLTDSRDLLLDSMNKRKSAPQSSPSPSSPSSWTHAHAVVDLTDDEFFRFDKRDAWRREHGIDTALSALSFIPETTTTTTTLDSKRVGVSSAACKVTEAWAEALSSDDSRFSYLILECIIQSARGTWSDTLVHHLLVGAKMFIESRKDFSEKLLLGTALFAAAYHNSGLIEILRDGGVPGNVTEIAHRCNLLDACRVGNDWAVKVILEEVVEGPPDLEAVKIAATRKYDKVLRTLLNDDEATRLSLISAREVILEVCGGEEDTGTAVPEAWQILQQRLA